MTAIPKPTKREATRQKVIEAAIDCIYRDGFHAAHTNRIAEEAGVSWGVLQYHFGDKDGLLQAVIDYIFDDFTATLGGHGDNACLYARAPLCKIHKDKSFLLQNRHVMGGGLDHQRTGSEKTMTL